MTIIARSIKFRSSRTFPGQEYRCKAAMSSFAVEVTGLRKAFENCSMKVQTRAGISSTRSRRDGTVIGEDVQAIEKILAEATGGHEVFEVPGRFAAFAGLLEAAVAPPQIAFELESGTRGLDVAGEVHEASRDGGRRGNVSDGFTGDAAKIQVSVKYNPSHTFGG